MVLGPAAVCQKDGGQERLGKSPGKLGSTNGTLAINAFYLSNSAHILNGFTELAIVLWKPQLPAMDWLTREHEIRGLCGANEKQSSARRFD